MTQDKVQRSWVSKDLLVRYGAAGLAVGLATWLRLMLVPEIGLSSPFITYFVAVVFAAWYGRLGSALLAMVLSTLAAAYFFIPPADSWMITGLAEQLSLLLFVLFSLSMMLMGEAMHRATVRAEVAAQAFQEQREWLQVTLSSIGDAVIATDEHGQITFVNPIAESLTGWNQGEAVGQPLPDVFRIINEQTREPVESPVEKVLRKGLIVGLANHTLLVCKDGSEVPIDDSGAPIRDAKGTLRGVVLVFRDIQERKQVEHEREQLLRRERAAREEAEAANRAKDEFLAILSHELRTPLNAILGWTSLLRTGRLDHDTAAQALETVERNARSQAQLVEDMLEVSRIITGKLRLEVQPLGGLSPVIEAAIDAVRPAAQAKELTLVTHLDAQAGAISGDPNRLQQIIWNLLSNAVKFTPKEGRVEVTLQQAGSQVEIVVSDNGTGIKPDAIPFIFDRFRQADSTTTRQYGGLGLGLSIVRHLVEMHGGTIDVSSAGEGQGTTFRVRLPMLAVYPPAQPAPHRETMDRVEANPLSLAEPLPHAPTVKPGVPEIAQTPASRLCAVRVLVVDDEADSREVVAFTLRQDGAEVKTCASAAEALTVLQDGARWFPHVLVSDIQMPEQDGYDLISRVRSLEEAHLKHLPAVALTAYARGEDQTRALKAGYQVHVAKPVEPRELVQVVAGLAQQR